MSLNIGGVGVLVYYHILLQGPGGDIAFGCSYACSKTCDSCQCAALEVRVGISVLVFRDLGLVFRDLGVVEVFTAFVP